MAGGWPASASGHRSPAGPSGAAPRPLFFGNRVGAHCPHPARPAQHPEEIATMVVWLATEAPDYMTAARLNVTLGLDKD
jgi:hypothetical protein